MGAIAWALVWIGYERLFEVLNVDKIVVPRIVEGIALVALGFLVGGPIGFILRKIPNRGDLLAGWLGMLFALASVVFGEIFYSMWLVYKAVKVISISIAIKIIPEYLADSGVFYITDKFILGIVCVAVAYQVARPQKKGLKL